MYFDTWNRLAMDHKCDRQTDGRTDFIVANSALHYVARPEPRMNPGPD